MLDSDGYRPNVGIILTNDDKKVFWAKRLKKPAWQFPQGGIDEGEDIETALMRELNEEIGLTPDDVKIFSLLPNQSLTHGAGMITGFHCAMSSISNTMSTEKR